MPVNKNSSKRMDYQQNENQDIRQKLKLLSDSRGLKRQSMLKPSNVDRIEGISNGGIKRGGKIYHSRKYRMIPTLYGEGRKIKKMESDVLESDTESESESEPENKKGRGRPPKKMESQVLESDTESESKPEPENKKGRGKLEITHYEGGAKLLGKSLMEELYKDPQFKLMGKGFFDKLLEGAKEFTRGVALPVKVAGKLIGNVVPPLKMAGKVVEGIDDPKWLKELKGKARGGKRGSPLQIENPNIRGSGFLDNLGYKKDFEKLGGPKLKGPILKKKGGKRKTSSWIEFVKKVAKEQNIPYREAMSIASKQYNK